LAKKLQDMHLVEVDFMDDLWYLHFATNAPASGLRRVRPDVNAWVGALPAVREACIDLDIPSAQRDTMYVLNSCHPVVRWLELLSDAAKNEPSAVARQEVEACWETAATAWFRMDDLLQRWSCSTRVPPALKPPRKQSGDLWRYQTVHLVGRYTVVEPFK
jgi:hypothetical protein